MRFNTTIRYTLSILLGFACTAAIFSSSIAETPARQVDAIEAVRGIVTLTLGIPASLGIATAQAAQSVDCLGFFGMLGRFALLIWPNLLLGLLWQRYRLRGGLAALALSGLWQLAIQKPVHWPLPAAGFIAAAVILVLCWLLEASVGFLIVKHAGMVTKMEYHAALSLSSSKLRRA